MGNKLLYWIPLVGVLLALANYNKENEIGEFWPYYQAITTMGSIFLITYFSLAK